ncbi:ead/Ea22-like family protein [Enterobacter mori]|uniref:ead/Ea22-like family protein n=1 Tax=Enterobacter mori TaxID=539813 RepID=UPI00402A7A40
MSNIDKRALREAAEKAGSDKWQAKKINGDFYVIRNGSYEKQHGITSYQPIAEIEHKPVRDFVAGANPATVLALLDELEAVQKTSAAHLGAIDTTHKMFQRERDRADAAEKRSAELSQKADIYDMLRQDYWLQGSLVDFVDWQAKRIADLESREVKLPELKMLRDYLAEVTMREREDILVGIRLEFFRALEEAGVKVAAAGKGE